MVSAGYSTTHITVQKLYVRWLDLFVKIKAWYFVVECRLSRWLCTVPLAIMCAVERCFSAFLPSINNVLPPLVFMKFCFRYLVTKSPKLTLTQFDARHHLQLVGFGRSWYQYLKSSLALTLYAVCWRALGRRTPSSCIWLVSSE